MIRKRYRAHCDRLYRLLELLDQTGNLRPRYFVVTAEGLPPGRRDGGAVQGYAFGSRARAGAQARRLRCPVIYEAETGRLLPARERRRPT